MNSVSFVYVCEFCYLEWTEKSFEQVTASSWIKVAI